MTKQTGFVFTVKYFIPIDKKDYAKQAAAFATAAEVTATNKLPEGFSAEILSVAVKQGSKDGDAVVFAPDATEQVAAAIVEGAKPVAETEIATGRRQRT